MKQVFIALSLLISACTIKEGESSSLSLPEFQTIDEQVTLQSLYGTWEATTLYCTDGHYAIQDSTDRVYIGQQGIANRVQDSDCTAVIEATASGEDVGSILFTPGTVRCSSSSCQLTLTLDSGDSRKTRTSSCYLLSAGEATRYSVGTDVMFADVEGQSITGETVTCRSVYRRTSTEDPAGLAGPYKATRNEPADQEGESIDWGLLPLLSL